MIGAYTSKGVVEKGSRQKVETVAQLDNSYITEPTNSMNSRNTHNDYISQNGRLIQPSKKATTKKNFI